jgi:DHA2 family multidrug resistance protein
MAVGLGSLEVVLEEGERKDWFGNPLIRNLAIVAAICTTVFIVIELVRERPFINLRLLARRNLGASCLIGLSLGLSLYGSIYILPVYLSQVQGYDASQIGYVIMWIGLPQLLIFPLMPLLMKRIDARILLAFGLIVFGISNFMNVHMSHDTAAPQLHLAMLVRALGQPFVITTITQMATAGIEAENAAGASSLFNVMRNLGGSIGIAMLQTFSTWREHFHFDVISERITRNDLRLQEHLRLVAQRMLLEAGNLARATDMAMAQLQATVRREAYVMAYSDCFYVMGAVLLLSVVAVFAMQKPPIRSAGAAH